MADMELSAAGVTAREPVEKPVALTSRITGSLARRMIAAQASRAQRLAIADDVLVNDGPLEALDAHVAALHRQYLALARGD